MAKEWVERLVIGVCESADELLCGACEMTRCLAVGNLSCCIACNNPSVRLVSLVKTHRLVGAWPVTKVPRRRLSLTLVRHHRVTWLQRYLPGMRMPSCHSRCCLGVFYSCCFCSRPGYQVLLFVALHLWRHVMSWSEIFIQPIRCPHPIHHPHLIHLPHLIPRLHQIHPRILRPMPR